MAAIQTMFIGVGDRDNPTAGGSGILYVDDIQFGRPDTAMPAETP